MKKLSKIITVIIATIIGIPIIVILFLPTSNLVLTFLDGQSHFINDTPEDINILIFTYDNYENNLGTIVGPYFIKPGDTKSFWNIYPSCVHIINSNKSFWLPDFTKNKSALLSKIISGSECPLDLKGWTPKTRWSCKLFGKFTEPCKQI